VRDALDVRDSELERDADRAAGRRARRTAVIVGVQIELFAVAPGDDEAFLASWRRERAGATLYRALRDDVRFRFVSVGAGAGYELVHEDGTPDVAGGVAQIAGLDEIGAWPAAAISGRRGYLGSRLYRALAPADFAFVVVARWSSPLMVARAAREVVFPAEAALYVPAA
jgi:hypothetical protein